MKQFVYGALDATAVLGAAGFAVHDLKAAEVRAAMREIKESLSDHLPCVSRFCFQS